MVILIPELGEIGKPELSNLFSELRIPAILEVLELFQSKAEPLVFFSFNIENPNFHQSSVFHFNYRTSKIERILSSEKKCESSGFHISLSSGIISTRIE